MHCVVDAADPNDFRTGVKKALLALTDDYKLPEVAPETAKVARESGKQIIAGVLQNVPSGLQ